MANLFRLAAIAEAATGVALFAVPAVVARLLLGTELTGVAVVVARVAGIAVFSLGIACWPSKSPTNAARCGMLTYSSLVAILLSYLGIRGEWVGPLLWPAATLHALLTILLVRGSQRPQTGNP